jgi:hypothetical protein
MKVRNIPVTRVIIRQLKEESLLRINSQGMTPRQFAVTYVTFKQLKDDP